MATYEYLPQTVTHLQDGNLRNNFPSDLVSVAVLGTAGNGLVERSYAVSSTISARLEYGTEGTLIRGMYEAQESGSGNLPVLLHRISGSTATLAGIGENISIEFQKVFDEVSSGYKLSWYSGTLKIWRMDSEESGTLVYEADMTGIAPVIATEVENEVWIYLDGTADTADAFGTGTLASASTPEELVGSPTIAARTTYTLASGEGWDYSLLTAWDGVGSTKKELYEALYASYQILEDENLHFIVPMEVYLDDYSAADALTEGSAVDPTTFYGTSDYLGYLNVVENAAGGDTFTWADTEVDDSYHEVNFAYQLANFCHSMWFNELSVFGAIGVKPPTSTAPRNIKTFVGKAPVYSTADDTVITVNGTGLLGNKFMAGRTDWTKGLFATSSGWLDDIDLVTDLDGDNIDIGTRISVFAHWVELKNQWAKSKYPTGRYTTSGAAAYAGILARLPSENGPTASMVPQTIKVPYRIAKGKLNSLSGQHYIVLRPTATGLRISTGWTAGQHTSDFRLFSTINTMKVVDREVRKITNRYLGKGITPEKVVALEHQLNTRMTRLVEAGKIQSARMRVTQTIQQAVNGVLVVWGDVKPPYEVIKIPFYLAAE